MLKKLKLKWYRAKMAFYFWVLNGGIMDFFHNGFTEAGYRIFEVSTGQTRDQLNKEASENQKNN